MTEKERAFYHWFAFRAGISNKKKRELCKLKKTPEQIYFFSAEECKRFFKEKERERFQKSCTMEMVKRDFEWMAKHKVWSVFWNEEHYPRKLKQIYDYPFGLLIKGTLPDEEKLSIAMVGSRDMSPYGQQAASYFSRELARSGVQIISGLARGIDGCCHAGALKEGGYTLGVLGCGIDHIYPRTNQHLYEQMELVGGILSEFPIGTSPQPYLFPIRNRIISGISDGVFVLEAKKRSGSLITANHAIEQNRDIFALPGRYYDEGSLGCLNLISDGAKPVFESKNITEEYENKYKICIKRTISYQNSLDKKEKLVYDCLRLEPKHIDQIISESRLSIKEVLSALTMLELKQCIIRTQKNYYRRKEQQGE